MQGVCRTAWDTGAPSYLGLQIPWGGVREAEDRAGPVWGLEECLEKHLSCRVVVAMEHSPALRELLRGWSTSLADHLTERQIRVLGRLSVFISKASLSFL